MTVQQEFVIVQKYLFDRLRRYCEICSGFNERIQDLDGQVVVIPGVRLFEQFSKKRKRKTEATNWFLQNVSKATEWRKRKIEFNLVTVKQYEDIIKAFTNRANAVIGEESCQKDGRAEYKLVELAEKLALLTKSSLMDAEF